MPGQELDAIAVKECNPVTDIVNISTRIRQFDLSLQEDPCKLYGSCEYVPRKFKQEYGINFTDYITVRIEKNKLLLQNPHLKLAQISEIVGFRAVKYFSKVFKKKVGSSPKEYRVQVNS
ncbi:helix-turn-helix transcriptional regulator [Paenibacillus illinoisensis]|uniref:helix-turn-helix transcriptional regulator n=1 Tax=Paenibacillus illinoisensis TaxID=59845 RepID=UPI00301C0436